MKVIRNEDLQFVPASHEDPQRPGVLKKVLAASDDVLAGQVQMVNWSLCPVGASFQPHYHEDMQEVFVIINGRVSMEVDGVSANLSGGDAILIDPKEVHKMTNTCSENVHYIVFGVSTGNGGKTVVVDSANRADQIDQTD